MLPKPGAEPGVAVATTYPSLATLLKTDFFCIQIKWETFQMRSSALPQRQAPGTSQMRAEMVHQPNELR